MGVALYTGTHQLGSRFRHFDHFWDRFHGDSPISHDFQDQGTQCDSSSSFKCSQVCNGGDADGYCCDSDSITYIKGTAYYCKDGLEACCGGTDSTTYCQKV